MKKRFTDEQITYALKRHESGVSADEICREMGVSSASFYKWKKKINKAEQLLHDSFGHSPQACIFSWCLK